MKTGRKAQGQLLQGKLGVNRDRGESRRACNAQEKAILFVDSSVRSYRA